MKAGALSVDPEPFSSGNDILVVECLAQINEFMFSRCSIT